jgi:hypothetical protein
MVVISRRLTIVLVSVISIFTVGFVSSAAAQDESTGPTLPKHAVRRYGATGVLPHLSNPSVAGSEFRQ